MIFNKKKNRNFTDIIKLYDISIDLVSSFKLLGIIIDDNLNYKNHIEYIVRKLNKNLGVINHIKYFINKTILISFYYSLFFSYIYYCNLIWASTYKTYLNKIYQIQRKFFNIIFNSYNKNNTFDVTSYIILMNLKF